jgi:SAM-dependent methyltransferase
VLRRWQRAQKAERLFWNSEQTVQAETQKILERYSATFQEIRSDRKCRVLDVGCGPTLVSGMVERGEKYCIDPLMNHLLEKTQDRSISASFHFLMGAGEYLPFLDGCFDRLVCRNVLDHVLCPEEVLKEMKRVSKGSAIVVFGAYVYSEFVARLKKDLERFGIILLKDEYHPHFFTERTFERLCSGQFSIVKRKTVYYDRATWIGIQGKTFVAQDRQEREKHSRLYRTLAICASVAVTLFWNIVRLLNRAKASYFMSEYALIACR